MYVITIWLKTEVQCFVCVLFFFFSSTWSLVSLPESPCLFEIFCCFLLEFQGLCFGLIGPYCLAFSFLLVARGSALCLIDIPLGHATRCHVWLGHLTMMPFTLYRLFYVIAWGNLLQEVSANGVILFLCFVIAIHMFFFCIYICLFVCLPEKKHTFIITAAVTTIIFENWFDPLWNWYLIPFPSTWVVPSTILWLKHFIYYSHAQITLNCQFPLQG